MLFQAPNGLDFTSIEKTRGRAIRSTMDKINAMEEFRKEEFLELLNKQYANVGLENPTRVKENSIVLVRNIGNEPKREPLKLARIEKVHDSRDNAQRVVTLTYNNVRLNKDGEWIGTPVQVDRCINDLILVDNALNESMLNARLLGKADNNQKKRKDDENKEESEEIGETRIGNTTMNETRNDVNDTVDGARDEITETGERSNDDTMNEEKIEVKKNLLR